MQMVISTTGRRPLCIFCSVSVLSKMLKLRSAEGSSFRLWWLLSVFCCWSRSCWRLSTFWLLNQPPGNCRMQSAFFVAKTAFWCSSSDSQCGVSWGEAFQMVSLQWLEPSVSVSVVVHQMSVSEVDDWSFGDRDLSHRSHRQNVGVWVGPRVSEDLCLDAVGHLWNSSILSASRIAKVTLIGNVAA